MLNLLYLPQFFKFNLKFIIMDEVFVLLSVPKSFNDYTAYLPNLSLPEGCTIMGAFSDIDTCIHFKTRSEVFLPDSFKLIVKHLHVTL